MHWVSTKEKYYGFFDDNRQNGEGVHIWLEPKGEGKYLRNRYEGEWDAGQRHGYGVFYYANGAKYEGSWNRNLKEGYAFFIDETGKESFSMFKGDKIVKEFEIVKKIKSVRDGGDFEVNLEIVKEMIEGSPVAKSKAESPSNKKMKNRGNSGKNRSNSAKKTEGVVNEGNNENKYILKKISVF